MNGGDNTDWLDGGRGDDVIEGGAGDDILIDGEGVDILDGGAGNDTLVAVGNEALAPADRLTGGSGNDKVTFSENHNGDTITDFTQCEDVIVFVNTNVDDVEDLRFFQEGDDVLIQGYFPVGDSITVENANVEDFSNDDFSFA